MKPISVIGYSSGEIMSIYAARALSLKDAMLISYSRGIVSSKMAERTTISGCIMAIGMSKKEVLLILLIFRKSKVVIVCSNSPSSMTTSSDLLAIDKLQTILDEKGVFNCKLVVEVVYYSYYIELVKEEYRSAIFSIKI